MYRKVMSGRLFLAFGPLAVIIPTDLLGFRFKGLAQTYEKATWVLGARKRTGA